MIYHFFANYFVVKNTKDGSVTSRVNDDQKNL